MSRRFLSEKYHPKNVVLRYRIGGRGLVDDYGCGSKCGSGGRVEMQTNAFSPRQANAQMKGGLQILMEKS